MTDRAELPARLRAHSGANIDLAIAVDCAKAAERIEVLEAELLSLRAFKRSVDEALNSGDGSYRP